METCCLNTGLKDLRVMPTLQVCSCHGNLLMGEMKIYKGGNYTMFEDTPLWVAEYGCFGRKLMDITDEGAVITAEDDTI